MPTASLAGDRSRRARSPRDLTGREFARLQAEQKAKEETASLDVNEVRHAAYMEGWSDGYDMGWEAALRAVPGVDANEAEDVEP